jgi:capsular exopolysaccharide synthesis family protein
LSEAQPARVSAIDSRSRLTKTLGIGFVWFLIPVALIVWLDARKGRISSGTEVVQGLGFSVLGAVPLVPLRVMRRLDGPSNKEKYWRALLSESVDSIAAVLLRGAKSNTLHSVMVSSANAGEGKTTLAANLATSLGGAGCRTLLVDFDLRRPALHRLFDLPLQPGLCEVLRDRTACEAAIQATRIPNLSFLAAGRCHAIGLAGLASFDLKSLFAELRDKYEFVVVDGSPILPVVDTRLIAQHVDTVVLSVLRDVSCVPQVRAAGELLRKFAIPILGVVVTGSRGDAYPGSYGGPYVVETQAV